jgi:hypothetical protein
VLDVKTANIQELTNLSDHRQGKRGILQNGEDKHTEDNGAMILDIGPSHSKKKR